MPEVHCYFFAALPCEAKPLINHFKLKKQQSCTAFTIYRNEHITLTVTGLGKSAMAAGVAYTLALFPAPSVPILLNVGIAGHCSHPLGSVFIAEKIIDQETGRCYYPQLVITPPCPTHELITVAKAQPGYPTGSLYEMEASAFYEISIRFSSAELIHCIKIISDNKNNPSYEIKPAQVSLLISGVMLMIAEYIQQLSQLAIQAKPFGAANYTEIINQWHFSSNEKIQLKSLLNKRAILIPDNSLDLKELSVESGKVVLGYLRKEIDAQAFASF